MAILLLQLPFLLPTIVTTTFSAAQSLTCLSGSYHGTTLSALILVWEEGRFWGVSHCVEASVAPVDISMMLYWHKDPWLIILSSFLTLAIEAFNSYFHQQCYYVHLHCFRAHLRGFLLSQLQEMILIDQRSSCHLLNEKSFGDWKWKLEIPDFEGAFPLPVWCCLWVNGHCTDIVALCCQTEVCRAGGHHG